MSDQETPGLAARTMEHDEASRPHALSRPSDGGSAGPCVDSHPELERTLSRLGGSAVNFACLLELLEAPRNDPERVYEGLRKCPSMAGRILGIANSASVGARRPITSLWRAVLLLGAEAARQTGLVHALRVSILRTSLPREMAERFWAGSVQKACLARKFCEATAPGASEELYDQAFTAGLIQDLGLPPLASVDPVFYAERLGREVCPDDWAGLERERFGICHGAVGNGMLLEWGASEQVQLDVLNHHRPPTRGDEEPTLLKLAGYLASGLSHLDEPAGREADAWRHAIFTRFLAERYGSPEGFLLAAANDAAEIVHCPGRPTFKASPTASEASAAIRETTGNELAMIGRLVRLENLLEQRSDECGDLRNEAFTDALTRLLNRRGFMRLAARRLEAARATGTGVCCLLLDLNKFKPINDTHGHHVGDVFLKGVGKLMRRNLQRNDLVARFGGDEFVAMVSGVTEDEAREVAGRLAGQLNRARLRVAEGLELDVSVSVGAAFAGRFEDEPGLAEALLRRADEAMYSCKSDPGGSGASPCFVVYGGEPADSTPASSTSNV